MSKESINYFSIRLSLGGGLVFTKLRGNQSILNYNSFLELELFVGYGVGLAEFKQHQMSILAVSLLRKF